MNFLKQFDLLDCLITGGFISVVTGLAMYSHSLALIVAGVLLWLVATMVARAQYLRRKGVK